jgi:hypothetical protein
MITGYKSRHLIQKVGAMRISAAIAERIGTGLIILGPMLPFMIPDNPSHYRLALALAVTWSGAYVRSHARRRLKATGDHML